MGSRGALALLYLLASALAGALAGPYNVPPTPQFILISHDDAITVTTNTAVRAVVNPYENAGGCNVPVTFFTSGGSGTSCGIANRLLNDNHEIATHTFAHASLSPGGAVNITEQIILQRDWLNRTCGIPLEKLIGFRAPYLLHNPESRAALQALGFKYDSSIIESWPSTTSPSSAARLWPYSMADGIVQNCQWMAPSTCNAAERYPDLFEIPLQQFLTGPITNGQAVALSTMDPTADSEAALLAQLRQQLSYSYDGNRAPITIALHTPWFSAKPFHASALSAFINEAVVKPGLFFVTYAQLRAWMLYPVPVSRMQSWLTCNPVDFQAEERTPCTTYTVKPNDTLYSILASQEIELADLLAVNPSLQNSTTAAIFLGQRLALPPYPASCPADLLSNQTPCRNHTVVLGDSLYGIAEQYELTVADVIGANSGLTTTSTLSLGRVLRIPPYPIECIYGNFTVVPTPTTSPAPAPASAPADVVVSDACGAEVVELDLQLTGFTADSWDAHQAAFTAGLAALVRETASCVTVTRTIGVGSTPAGQRRLLAAGARTLLSDPQLLVLASIHTANATRVAGYLRDAQQLGTVDSMLTLLGAARLDKVAWTALSAQGMPIASAPTSATAASPAPAPAASPATPVPSPATPPVVTAAEAAPASSPTKNRHLGAIIGGAVGGGVGALLVIAVLVYVIHRRQATALPSTGAGGLRAAWNNPTYSGAMTTAGATATITGPASKEAFELAEVVEATGTPRSARRRANTPFN